MITEKSHFRDSWIFRQELFQLNRPTDFWDYHKQYLPFKGKHTPIFMIFPVQADLVPVIKGVIAALQPFAKAHEIKLYFEEECKSLVGVHNPG